MWNPLFAHHDSYAAFKKNGTLVFDIRNGPTKGLCSRTNGVQREFTILPVNNEKISQFVGWIFWTELIQRLQRCSPSRKIAKKSQANWHLTNSYHSTEMGSGNGRPTCRRIEAGGLHWNWTFVSAEMISPPRSGFIMGTWLCFHFSTWSPLVHHCLIMFRHCLIMFRNCLIMFRHCLIMFRRCLITLYNWFIIVSSCLAFPHPDRRAGLTRLFLLQQARLSMQKRLFSPAQKPPFFLYSRRSVE